MTLSSTFIKVFRFSITGLIGMLFDFGFTFLFKEALHFNVYLSNAFGVSIAIAVIFLLHKNWTFSDTAGSTTKQFGQFLVISILGLILNTLLLYLFQHYSVLPFYIGKMVAILIIGIWNFLMNTFITFKSTLILKDYVHAE